MTMYMLDDKPIDPYAPFEHDDIVYPPGWLIAATPEEKAALGVTEVPDPPPINWRYYQFDGSPKPIEQVQDMLAAEIKTTAQAEIYRKYPAWHQSNVVSRGVELATASVTGRAITPKEVAEVAAYQVIWDDIKALRQHSDDLEAEMLALPFEELTAWQQHGWPSASDPMTPLPKARTP